MKRKIDTEQGSLSVRPAARDGGTGVRQHLQRPPPAAVQPQEQEEGERAVAALLHGAQHRQAAALRGSKNIVKAEAGEESGESSANRANITSDQVPSPQNRPMLRFAKSDFLQTR